MKAEVVIFESRHSPVNLMACPLGARACAEPLGYADWLGLISAYKRPTGQWADYPRQQTGGLVGGDFCILEQPLL